MSSLANLFQQIADAIREKTGHSSPLIPTNFPAEIRSIESTDLSGVTATAGDVKTGKAFVNSNGVTVNGSMPVITPSQINLAVNGNYTIPAGYHSGLGSVSNTTQTKAAETFYAGTTQKTLIESGKYLTGNQVLAPVSFNNLEATNIKKGVNVSVYNGNETIQSVTGTYEAPASLSYTYVNRALLDPSEVEDHTYGYYTDSTVVAGTVMKSLKVTVPEDARFLAWEAMSYRGLTDGKQWFRIGFIRDLSYKGAADGSGYVVDGTGEWQCASFCERPDNINPNKKIVYVPVEKITSGGTTLYRATYVIGW